MLDTDLEERGWWNVRIKWRGAAGVENSFVGPTGADLVEK